MTEETTSTCGRCNRVLKSTKSRENGYGPVCWKKVQQEKEDESQEKMEGV